MFQVTDLATLGKYAVVKDDMWASLLHVFGNPDNLDDFLAIPKDMLLDGLKAFEFKVRVDAVPETFSLVQIGRISKWQDITRSAKPDPVSTPAVTTSIKDASILLKHVVNDTLEGYVTRPTNDDMTKLLLVYQTRCGGLPRDEIEPTPDQIGALRQVLDSGAPPYVDFSVWGPHMKRGLKKLQQSATLFDPGTSKWVQKSLRGPPSFDIWLKCWYVFKVAMIMLEQASTASLDAYEARIRELASETYPLAGFWSTRRTPGVDRNTLRRSSEQRKWTTRPALSLVSTKLPPGTLSLGRQSTMSSPRPWRGGTRSLPESATVTSTRRCRTPR